MSKQKTPLGIALFLALALSAFWVASASASGATGFTCVKEGGNKDLFGPHCLKESTGDSSKYGHVAFSGVTTATATNANTASSTITAAPAILKSTLAGVTTTIQCTEVHGEGLISNKEEGGEMFEHGEGELHLTGCTVTAPSGKGCKVHNSTIATNPLTWRTVGNGEKVKLESRKITIGEVEVFLPLAEITIEGCTVSALNNTFPLTGSLEARTNGATMTATHTEVTNQGQLKFGGQKAGLEGALTFKAHQEGEETKPISVTATP